MIVNVCRFRRSRTIRGCSSTFFSTYEKVKGFLAHLRTVAGAGVRAGLCSRLRANGRHSGCRRPVGVSVRAPCARRRRAREAEPAVGAADAAPCARSSAFATGRWPASADSRSGVLGGPFYSVLKACSALQMAEELTARGVAADCGALASHRGSRPGRDCQRHDSATTASWKN